MPDPYQKNGLQPFFLCVAVPGHYPRVTPECSPERPVSVLGHGRIRVSGCSRQGCNNRPLVPPSSDHLCHAGIWGPIAVPGSAQAAPRTGLSAACRAHAGTSAASPSVGRVGLAPEGRRTKRARGALQAAPRSAHSEQGAPALTHARWFAAVCWGLGLGRCHWVAEVSRRLQHSGTQGEGGTSGRSQCAWRPPSTPVVWPGRH